MKNLLALAIMCGVVPAAVAAGPWDGTWKLDRSKSHLTGTTFTYSKAANGKWHYSDGTVAYDFALDGKPVATLSPETTAAFTPDGDHALNIVFKMKNNLEFRTHEVLSSDGKTLTDHTVGTRPDGSKLDDITTSERVGAGSGFTGTWKSTKDESNSAGSYTIVTNNDLFKWSIPEFKETVEGKMNGGDNPIKGETVPGGMTLAVSKISPSKLSYKAKKDGKVMGEGTMTLAADGKTFTNVSWAPAKPNEKTTGVYVKQ